MPVKRSKKIERKLRVTNHVIADLSANYVERLALQNRFSVESFEKDYGYDLNIFTFNRKGEFENGNIFVQLKATKKLRLIRNGTAVSFPTSKKDILHWSKEPLPVFLIIYDAKKEEGYWLYIQKYLETSPGFNINKIKDSYTVRIPATNVIDKKSIKKFRTYKQKILRKIQATISHA